MNEARENQWNPVAKAQNEGCTPRISLASFDELVHPSSAYTVEEGNEEVDVAIDIVRCRDASVGEALV